MFPLSPFLRTLEQDGFRLTIRDYDRIAMVLSTDGDWTLQRLRSVLRTLLARNREQQDIFERRFDTFFADLADASSATVAVDFDLIKGELEQLKAGRHRGLPLRRFSKTGSVSGRPLPKKKYPWFPGGVFRTLLFVLLIGCAVFWPDSLQEAMVVPDAPASQQNEVKGPEPTADLNNLPRYVVQPRRPVIASRELTPVTGNDSWQQSILIVGILFLLCCVYAWYLYKAQKVPKDKPAYWDKDDPTLPRLFRLDRVGGKPASRLDQETLVHLADCLGYFQGDRPHREPDIPRSLIATIDNGGLPNLIFSQRKELRRLIILINQADPEALRLNPIADELAMGMERLGVQLLVGRYYNDPAVFFPEDGRARFLADYEADRNGYLLLIFSGTSELNANRQTLEALARWPHIAWMQLRTDSFQAGSMVHRYGIANYPANQAGLVAAFTRFLTETGSVQRLGSVSCQRAELRGDVAVGILLETRLADALPWVQACSILQPVPLGLADCLRREFFAHLPPERIERLMALPGTSLGKGGFSFSHGVLKELRWGFQIRCPENPRKAILERILAELEKSWQAEYGKQAGAKSGLARLAWQKYFQLVNLWLKPEQALKGIAELEGSPLGSAMEADLAMIDPVPLREKLGDNKDALQRLARLFGKRSGLSLLTRYPLRWFQWVGAAVLVLSLLTASGMGVQEWLAAGNGEARLSVLAEQGGGIGWVGVEESGASLEKRASTEGLLRLPLETRLPLRKEWQLVFYDDALQPVHTVELGRISENQLVRLEYEKAETPGETGELVVTDKQRNVLEDAEVTLRSSLFTTTARADRTLVLPVGEYEVQVENSKGIGTVWQKVSVSNDAKKIEELKPTWFRDSLQNGGFGPAMVPIEGGSFRMGDIQGQGENDEKPVHKVTLDSFALGRYEVTVGEFRAFVEQSGYQPKENSSCFVDQDRTGRGWKEIQEAGWDNPLFAQSDDQPVVCVSWEDATAYAKWLSEETGQQYRLPTEAEWEYAARFETETVHYWGDDPEDGCGFANVADAAMDLYYPSEKKDWEFHNCLDGWVYTAPAGSLNPNGFFLHDMLGNAWESAIQRIKIFQYENSAMKNFGRSYPASSN